MTRRHWPWAWLTILAVAMAGAGALSAAVSVPTSADCFSGPAWPAPPEARGTTFVGVFRGATTMAGTPFPRFDWTVERVYAGDLEPGHLEGWGVGRPSCHPLVLREGVRYLMSSSIPTGGDAFDTVAYEVRGGGRVRLASFGAQQPARTAPDEYRVRTLRQALRVLAPDALPLTDTAPSEPPPGGPVQGDPPTVGRVPDDPDAPMPDFIPVSYRDRDGIAGYVASRDLSPGSFPWWYQQPPTPVYARDLRTLVGFMFAGKGFVPLGVDPRSIPDVGPVAGPDDPIAPHPTRRSKAFQSARCAVAPSDLRRGIGNHPTR